MIDVLWSTYEKTFRFTRIDGFCVRRGGSSGFRSQGGREPSGGQYGLFWAELT